MKVNKLAKNFENWFGDDKPNASLTHWNEDGDFSNHVYEIKNIRKKNGRYILRTNLIEKDFLQEISDDPIICHRIGCVEPPIIDQANFFIDSLSNIGVDC